MSGRRRSPFATRWVRAMEEGGRRMVKESGKTRVDEASIDAEGVTRTLSYFYVEFGEKTKQTVYSVRGGPWGDRTRRY